MWKCVYSKDMVHTYTLAHTTHNTVGNWRFCLYLCATLAKNLLDHTSNSVQDTNWALWWPSVAGSLMISTSLSSTVQWFPLRTGLFWSICWAGRVHGSGWEAYWQDLQWTLVNCTWLHVLSFQFLGHLIQRGSFLSFTLLQIAQRGSGSKGFGPHHIHILVRNTHILYMLASKWKLCVGSNILRYIFLIKKITFLIIFIFLVLQLSIINHMNIFIRRQFS